MVVEAFHAFEEFSQKKINLDQEAFDIMHDIYHQRVTACFLKIDLSFLDKEEEEGGAEGEGVAGGGTASVKAAEGCSELALMLEIVPTSAPSKATPALLLVVKSGQPTTNAPGSSIEPHIKVNDI